MNLAGGGLRSLSTLFPIKNAESNGVALGVVEVRLGQLVLMERRRQGMVVLELDPKA